MNELAGLALAVCAGIALGVVFFGGLWWTVRKSLTSRRAELWFAGSLVLRTTIVLAGFYLIGGDRWEEILACLLGFTAARSIMTRLSGWSGERRARVMREADDAPQP